MSRRPVKHSVKLNGHRTSVSLEDEFWNALRDIAAREKTTMHALITEIDVARGSDIGLATALRLFVLNDLQTRLSGSQTDAR
ncbi:MAG: ribbon-helix-helix domain-containing protein [Pseudomonadota bacterium]